MIPSTVLCKTKTLYYDETSFYFIKLNLGIYRDNKNCYVITQNDNAAIMEDKEKKPRFRDKEIEILVLGVKERSDIINLKFHDVINDSKKHVLVK